MWGVTSATYIHLDGDGKLNTNQMHNILLSTLLCVHVSNLQGHPQGDSCIIITYTKHHCSGFKYAARSTLQLM
jgi:hypothetical protein